MLIEFNNLWLSLIFEEYDQNMADDSILFGVI